MYPQTLKPHIAIVDTDVRPMTFAELFDSAFVLFSRQGLTLLKITSAATVPLALLFLGYFHYIVTRRGAFVLDEHIEAMLLMSALLTLALMGLSVARGAVAIAVFRTVDGASVSAWGCWRDALRRSMPLSFAGLFAWAATFVGAWFCLLPALLPMLWWSLTRAVIVREDLPPLTALRRSRQLLRGQGGKVCLVQGMFAFLSLLALFNLGLLVTLLLVILSGFLTIDTSSVTRLIYGQGRFNYVFGMWLATAVFVAMEPLKGCVDALLYLDARVRAEGVDLQHRLRSLGMGAMLLLVLTGSGVGAAENPRPTPEQAREALADVLRRPEFEEVAGSPELQRFWKEMQGKAISLVEDTRASGWLQGVKDAFRRFDNWWKRTWQRFENWLRQVFRSSFRSRSSSRWLDFTLLLPYAVMVILIFALLFLVYFVVRTRQSAGEERAAEADGAAGAPEDATTRSPDEWRAVAVHWAHEGNFRDGLRALYLAMLSHLHRTRRIDYHRARTNWAYVRGFQGPPEERAVFTELTYTFDEKWYGARTCTQDDFERFADGVKTLVEAKRET
ncbi:MAG: DUF4129 domain-containing protein [Abditibacteriales bacterium]|nr:DUF4129 domain-containing protein [Abditibacteriales bacterium]MDW8364479.1 DUF4129 domain-containing protein [Abditibacteriales bacterium]